MPAPNSRFRSLPPFPLADMKARRRQLEADGVDVIDLGAGDAPLPPPPMAVEALKATAGDPVYSRYPFQMGLPEFREEIAAFMERRFSVTVDPWSEVLPLLGSKDGIAHLALAYLEPGDLAVVPDPAYQAYLGSVLLAGAEPRLVPLRPQNDFLVPLDALSADDWKRARVLYLNYPNNPTAAVAPDEYLASVIEHCRRYDVLLAYDNAYSEFGFDGYRPRSILEFDGAREVAIEFHSLSKTFNMTGWRIGWAVGSAEVVATLQRVKTFMDTGAFLAVQAAAAAALRSSEAWAPGNVEVFGDRRSRVVEALRAAGFDAALPSATMYVWVPVPGGGSAEAFARRALDEAGVIVLPGSALGEGGEGFFRVALTVEAPRLVEAVERLAHLVH